MSTTTRRRRRRSLGGEVMTRRLTIQLPDGLAERLDELTERYEVAQSTIAREAITAGLKVVHERLRRAARSQARGAHAEAGEPPEATA